MAPPNLHSLSPAQLAVEAIRAGDVTLLEQLLAANPGLATARPDGQRTLLHTATDWPGHFPNAAAVIALLVAAGADVNAPMHGTHTETPLHWAASSNDIAALDALLDHGANIEATGAVIGGGTPLADAVAFAQWDAARRLIERGAESNLWQSAALGMLDRLSPLLAATPPPTEPELTQAFWCACHGGQQPAAALLLAHGANPHWIGYDNLTPLGAAQRSGSTTVVAWLEPIIASASPQPSPPTR